jgi:hypothetical protein
MKKIQKKSVRRTALESLHLLEYGDLSERERIIVRAWEDERESFVSLIETQQEIICKKEISA